MWYLIVSIPDLCILTYFAFVKFNDIVSTKIYAKRDGFYFEIVNFYCAFLLMVMFLALHPKESISLNSFVLLEHLVMLLNLTLAINYQFRNFLNKAIGIINFAKPFHYFIDDTMILYLNSKLDLNLSCAKDFQNLSSMVTWCMKLRRLFALIIFQRSSLK